MNKGLNTQGVKCFDGQILTFDLEKLREHCANCTPPKQLALKMFVDWQQKKLVVKTLKNGKTNMHRKIGSYGLKHRVEDLSKHLQTCVPGYRYEYISNEDLIIAMVQAGFRAENIESRTHYNPSPNYYFNIDGLKDRWIQELMESYNETQC